MSKHGSSHSYLIGLMLSVLLTVGAYVLVAEHLFDAKYLVVGIISLAFIQLWVQLIFFLHMDREDAPRWNLAVLVSTVGVIFILVAGSLWIMSNLNKYHISGTDANTRILHDEGIQR